MSRNAAKHILIAPLDWGLGHTTRCVPILHRLVETGHRPVFAGTEWQQDYIRKTLPGLETLQLPGYDIRYNQPGERFAFAMLRQVPGLLARVRAEHNWLKELLQRRSFDGVISDNRYGLFHKGLPSVILTHQLRIQTGMGARADGLLQSVHYRMLQRFDQIWVPDIEENGGLGGSLSHPDRLPKNCRYIGLLSQMDTAPVGGAAPGLLVLLSGPEPQRTVLSDQLWRQVVQRGERTYFVEGAEATRRPEDIPGHIQYFGRLTRKALQPLLQAATGVWCRSGYSTLMDLMALGKQAVVIPTPGQTEQEYLGSSLHEKGLCYCLSQDQVEQGAIFSRIASFPFLKPFGKDDFNHYQSVLTQWIDTC